MIFRGNGGPHPRWSPRDSTISFPGEISYTTLSRAGWCSSGLLGATGISPETVKLETEDFIHLEGVK
jgi:hypothetical protein